MIYLRVLLNYFIMLLGGEEFFNFVATETNNYAEFVQQTNNTVDKGWEPVTPDEIRAFIGVEIYMGLYDLPEHDCI